MRSYRIWIVITNIPGIPSFLFLKSLLSYSSSHLDSSLGEKSFNKIMRFNNTPQQNRRNWQRFTPRVLRFTGVHRPIGWVVVTCQLPARHMQASNFFSCPTSSNLPIALKLFFFVVSIQPKKIIF